MESPGIETSQQAQGIPLYKNSNVDVFVPKKPNVPVSEGLQIRVESTTPTNKGIPNDILKRYLYSILAAKVVAEGNQTPQEAWANTRIEDNNDVNTYGRNTLNPESWRKPVDTHNRNAPDIDTLPEPYDEKKLQRLFASYMHKWEKTADEMKLFEMPVQDLPIDTSIDTPEADKVVWQSDEYIAKIITNSHVNGTHVVVDAKYPPGGEFPRQWITRLKRGEPLDEKYIKMTLESTAIALGIRDLLGGGRGEIHNSGNWAGGLKHTEDGGALDANAIEENPKKEKRSHRPDVSGFNDFGTFMHVHVYIPTDGRVMLPVMSEAEARDRMDNMGSEKEKAQYRMLLEQWGDIPKTTQEKTDHVRESLGGRNLSNWINNYARGKLI